MLSRLVQTALRLTAKAENWQEDKSSVDAEPVMHSTENSLKGGGTPQILNLTAQKSPLIGFEAFIGFLESHEGHLCCLHFSGILGFDDGVVGPVRFPK